MKYLLITEGASDRMLLRPIEWLLDAYCAVDYAGEWANPSVLETGRRDLATRLAECARSFPCDLAFVHRDVDVATTAERRQEINDAVVASGYAVPVVCAIPVRMTEAWFLFSEQAIKRAADNPGSSIRLGLPTSAEAQRRADPKAILETALVEASELAGRKLDSFKRDLGRRKGLVASHTDDFSALRLHQSFVEFEQELIERLRGMGCLR